MKRFLPLLIFVVLAGVAMLLALNPPEAQRRGPPDGPQTVVDVVSITATDYQIKVSSYGNVAPRTQSLLVAQISGQITQINPNFRPGGFFKQDEELVTIDPRDYQANVDIAAATLMDALQAEAQERARSDQAKIDWDRLGNADEAPSDLVLRIPQLEAAKARVASARSNLKKAELNLERTRIRAPFDGRVLQQLVDVGQVVSAGSQLAEVYATDYVEVRLPIRNADLPFVDLPESPADTLPTVTLQSELGTMTQWRGQIVRTEGAIDAVSRQLHVVAQIAKPFNRSDRPLKIGEYVTAVIDGRRLKSAIVIPIATIYQNSYVYVVEDNQYLLRREIDIAWQNGVEAVVSGGLSAGDTLVTTPLGQVTSGTRVRVNNGAAR